MCKKCVVLEETWNSYLTQTLLFFSGDTIPISKQIFAKYISMGYLPEVQIRHYSSVSYERYDDIIASHSIYMPAQEERRLTKKKKFFPQPELT